MENSTDSLKQQQQQQQKLINNLKYEIFHGQQMHKNMK